MNTKINTKIMSHIYKYYLILACFACYRYAYCEHFVFALGPLALEGGELRFNTLHIVAIIIPFFSLKIAIFVVVFFNQRTRLLHNKPLEQRFWDNFEICLLYVHINNKYLPHVVDNVIFGISGPDYPIITVGTTILGQF